MLLNEHREGEILYHLSLCEHPSCTTSGPSCLPTHASKGKYVLAGESVLLRSIYSTMLVAIRTP